MVVHTLEQRWEILRQYFEKFGQKNHLFRFSSVWSWRVCKQAKLSHLEHGKPHAYIEKPTHPKRVTVWCGFWSKRHNWAIFLRKWARRGRYSQWRWNVERIFVHKNWRGGYWQHLVSTGRGYVPHIRWRPHYQPQRWCRLATSDLRFDTVGLLFVRCRQR